jgi:hypothetical protein
VKFSLRKTGNYRFDIDFYCLLNVFDALRNKFKVQYSDFEIPQKNLCKVQGYFDLLIELDWLARFKKPSTLASN